MLPVYLGCLCLGGILILASLLLGGDHGDHDHDLELGIDVDADLDLDGDLDVDADADLDLDADADVDKDLDLQKDLSDAGGNWLPFLSMRFWTFALATFGGAGALLDLIGFSDLITVPSALVTGMAVGLAVSWAFHKLKNERVTGDVGLRQIRGREGQLLLPVGPDKMGKVKVLIDGQDVYLPAQTQDDHTLAIREKVLVIGVKDGIAQVTSVAPGRRSKDE